jgi:RNA polymerase sigma factor (sigma-70 family)
MINEVELINSSLNGDKGSFGKIVRIYQSLICSITYNSIGDFHASEDLAQETFFTAWKNLNELQDKSKFKFWLCGIARNLTNEYIRQKYRNITAQSQSLDTTLDIPTLETSPRDAAISREEENILWESLKNIPEIYRETLVLYYREDRSIKSVAEALEISEDAVKQRLSRGRTMLKEQVVAFIENTLQKSRPSETFAIAVIAALPALAPQITASTIALAAAKGTTAFKSAVSFLFLGSLSSIPLGYIGGIFGSLMGISGGIIGAGMSIRNAKSPLERQFLIKSMGIMLGWIIVFYISLLSVKYFLLHNIISMVTIIIGLTLIHLIGFAILIIWMHKRIKTIQIEDGTFIDPAEWKKQAYQHLGKLRKGQIYGGYAGSIFGAICWMLVLCIMAKDWFTAIMIILAAGVIYFISTKYCLRYPIRYYKIAIGISFSIYAITVVAIYFRWDTWKDYFFLTEGFFRYHIPNRIELIFALYVIYCIFALLFHRLDKKVAKMASSKHEINLNG